MQKMYKLKIQGNIKERKMSSVKDGKHKIK